MPVLHREAAWCGTARRLADRWERLTRWAADDPSRGYARLLTYTFIMSSAMFTYEQAKPS